MTLHMLKKLLVAVIIPPVYGYWQHKLPCRRSFYFEVQKKPYMRLQQFKWVSSKVKVLMCSKTDTHCGPACSSVYTVSIVCIGGCVMRFELHADRANLERGYG